MKYALLSVYDKTDLILFANALKRHRYAIVSTGGTLQALLTAHIEAHALSDYTKQPEILRGRVKTLHPAVFAGILARPTDEDERTLAAHDYARFDLVAVNLYPFVGAAKAAAAQDELIEQIDIGGPSMLRAAAKNYARVTVCSDAADYAEIIAALDANQGDVPEPLRRELAVRTFYRTAAYDAQIAQTLAARASLPLAARRQFAAGYDVAYALRYGENPHQQAAALIDPLAEHSLLAAAKLQGKALSYNNLLDADAALRLLVQLSGPARAVIVKHNVPCGAAIAQTIEEACAWAFKGDEKSAFGGIVALSDAISAALAEKLAERFLEVIVAPRFDAEARRILSAKKNVRLLELPQFETLVPAPFELRPVLGGAVVQSPDFRAAYEPKVATEAAPSAQDEQTLRFAWQVCRAVHSNAIVVARAEPNGVLRTVGIGGGQTSRVDAVRIALAKAGELARGAAMASDGFFPFADSLELAQSEGIRAIVQPGGSLRDADVISAANRLGLSMCLTGVRHFRH